MLKRTITLLLCMALLLTLLPGCWRETPDAGPTVEPSAPTGEPQAFSSGYGLRAAILYADGEEWLDTLYSLEQSPMLGLEAEGVRIGESVDLAPFDLVYLDESLLDGGEEELSQLLMDYTGAGGAVFVPNGFCQSLPAEYLGISHAEALGGFCTEPAYPEVSGDAGQLQRIIRDFASLYPAYSDFQALSQKDYGLGVAVTTATALVNWGDLTAYALNSYGEGTVFLTNPMLPNAHSTGSLTMEREEGDSAFASTTASFNQLLLCGFAEYVAKEKFGYALERVYGYFGTPSMSWELHYEEITGIANSSLQIFSQLCEEYSQIPSFTLIRNSYTWFQRTESVTYLLNQSDSGFDYQMDYDESAYSSGTHIDADGRWLTLVEVENGGSYFLDYPEYTNRAYPHGLDYDGDGRTDLVCGSMDGRVYYYHGVGFTDGRLQVSAAVPLTDLEGVPLNCGEYSAPQLADIDRDGLLDLVCGWADGGIRWFRGNGTTAFEPQGLLLQCDYAGQVLPSVGDLNGDDIADLAVGSAQGILMLYYGRLDEEGRVCFSHFDSASLSKVCSNGQLGNWLAPGMTDWNGDGLTDLAVGVYHGYIAILLAQPQGGYEFHGYITAEEMNYKGNNNLKFGNWAVPCFADLDGDGRPDLLCGSQEYGIAYPIDSGYFPYEQQLREQVAYVQEHDYYMGVHFYTNSYASPRRELYELQAHRQAMEYYGLDTEKVGVNQHTWYTSSQSSPQTMSSIYASGLYWQSGFASSGAAATAPQYAAENVVALPFFLMEEGRRTTLVQNNAVVMYAGERWEEISARYHMPVCVYYHCDFAYQSESVSRTAIEAVEAFRTAYGYNFNREDQLMLASAAALHQTVTAAGGLTEPNGLRLSPGAVSGEYELYDEAVYRSLGVRVALSERVDAEALQIDADVWYVDDNCVILGLNREVRLCLSSQVQTGPHISRVNMAADIRTTAQGAVVEFLSGGMMELAVEGEASTDSEGWTVTTREDETIFTKYGSCESLNLIF